jgi:type VI secretion system protein ImpL
MKLLKALLHPWVLIVVGLLVLSAVIWWIGPLVAIADFHPLDPAWVRLALILLAVVLIAGGKLLKAWKAKRAEKALADGIAASAPAPGEKEVAVLGERFSQAMSVLQSTRQGPVWNRSQPLYDMPWYMFIGAPGSGKTTALLNAGLTFPLAAKTGEASVKGVGGTRNCDWWFTDEAVLIDTAGRYTLQQSDASVDATAWDGFLSLLRKHRPRRPINGVLLTVNVQDLLQQGNAERQEHAARLRARLQELQNKLGIRPPVYVLITKTDLIAGFNETFQNLGKEERNQVLGFTFPAPGTAADGADPLAGFDAEYRLIEDRLRAQVIDRMQAERDVLTRAAVFAFPQQFGSIRPLLSEFLQMVFSGGGKLEDTPMVRGVYFTSGTQEGTPIDRVLGALARTFGVERRAPSLAPGGGKSFFLNRLLRELVFAEQGLAGANRKTEQQLRLIRIGSFVAIGVVSTVLLIGWAVSAFRNKAYGLEVYQRVPALKQATDAVPEQSSGDATTVGAMLTAVHDAAVPPTFPLADPPLLSSLGLYQGDKLDAAAQIAYRRLLEHALLPRIARRTEELLRGANRNNLEFAYEALKAYLMLHQPDRYDPEALKTWVTIDWDANLPRGLSPEQRAQLDGHLDALLALGAPRRIAAMDPALLGNVRDMLASYPLEVRVYSRLQRMRLGQQYPEFSVGNVAGTQAGQVFRRVSGAPLTSGVPGLYTKDGYYKGFRLAVDKAAAQLASEEGWVLGIQGGGARAKDLAAGSLTGSVRKLYLDDYIKVWDQYIADVKLVDMGDLDRSVQVARILAGVDSPLARYVRGIAKETRLTQADTVAGTLLNKLDEKTAAAKKEIAGLIGSSTAPPEPVAAKPEQVVDDHFSALQRMVEGQPAPIDGVQAKFNEIYLQLSAVQAARNGGGAPPPGGGAEKAKAEAGLQPEPIRSMLEALADAGVAQSRGAEIKASASELKPITDNCVRSVAGRYPFASGAKADVLPDDFGQMFGAGGLLDEFFKARLAQLVDTGTTPWSYRPLATGARPSPPAALADFQRAARIREVFFRNGGKTPAVKIDIRALELSDGLKEISIDIDGQVSKFTAGSSTPVTLVVPVARTVSQLKLTALPGTTSIVFDGPWALFRLMDRFDVQTTAQPERFVLGLNLDGRRAKLEVTASSVFNPFRLRELQQFHCPGSL